MIKYNFPHSLLIQVLELYWADLINLAVIEVLNSSLNEVIEGEHPAAPGG